MKRILSVMLILGLLCGAAPVAYAQGEETTSDAAYLLYDLGLFRGVGNLADGTPDFDLDRSPMRYEAVTMLVRLLGKEEAARVQTWDTPFTDVVAWAEPYVGYAYAMGLTNGVGANAFGGDTTVSAAQYITFVLRALGYSSSTDFRWDAPWELSDKIGLTHGEFSPENNTLTRGLAAVISADALEICLKDSEEKLCDKLMAEQVFTAEQYERAVVGDGVKELPLKFDDFMKQWNAAHRKATQYRYSESLTAPYTKSFADTLDLVSEEEAKSTMNPRRNWAETCTKEDALSDIDLLFRLFKAYYAAYDYFGGDALFDQARQKAETWIAGCEGDAVRIADLQVMLVETLLFIQDGHLQVSGPARLNGNSVLEQTNQVLYDYYVKDLFLYRDTRGYYACLNGHKWYLDAVGEEAPEEYLRLSIDEKGELCYIVSFSAVNGSEQQKISALSFRRGENTILYPMQWTRFTKRDLDLKDYYQTVSTREGIVLVEVMDNEENAVREVEVPKKLREIGRQIKDEEIVIFDVMTSYDYDQLLSPRGYNNVYSELQSYKASKVAEYIGRTRIMPEEIVFGQYTIWLMRGTWLQDDGYKFVLQDKWNGSGMESYLHAFKTMENSVLVGGRSQGLQICGGGYRFWLPRTGVGVHFGMNMMFDMGETGNVDGIGYEPDVWVDPVNATEAIIRLCKFYGL